MTSQLSPVIKSKYLIFTTALSTFFLIYKLVDAAGNAEFLLQKAGVDEPVAKFLGSSRGIDFMVAASLLAFIITLLYQLNRHPALAQVAVSNNQSLNAEPVAATHFEQVDERIKELERKLEEETKKYQSQLNQKEDVLKHLNSVELELDTLKTQYKWLHELADQDKKVIDQRVKVIGCEIIGHDLLKELYVDFKFTILNASVYAVSIDENSIKGDIYFNSRLLSKGNRIIENAARFSGHAEIKDFIVRQWFDRDEIGDILDSSDNADKFRLGGLDITVNGRSDDAGVYPKKLNVYSLSLPSKPLRDLYQKLDINILSASFNGFYPDGTYSDRGLRVHIKIRATNPRPVHVTIQSFKLATKINGIDYLAYAKEGEIRKGELLDWNHEKVIDEGQKLENLNPSRGSLIVLEPKEFCEGWLQFDIDDVGFDEPQELSATLAVIDTRDEEHPMKCTLTYNSER